jgi:vancomycin resistance protein YoaR
VTRVPRSLLLAAGGVVVVGVVGLGATTAFAGDSVARGVHVADVDLGGQDRAQARRAIEAALAGRSTAAMAVLVDGVRKELHPAASGLSLDTAAVVDDAVSTGPIDRLRGLLGARREVAPRASVDEDALRTAVTRLKHQVDRKPREGAVRFRDGATPYALPPLTGRSLDLDGTVEAVRQAYLRSDRPVELPVEVAPVKSTAAGVQAALTTVAQPAVAAPIVLEVEGEPLEVRPADIAAGLTLEADAAGVLAPKVDGAKVLASLGDRVDAVESEPTDARIRIRDGQPTVVPAVTGKTLQAAPLGAAVARLLAQPAPRQAVLPLQVEQPELTTAEAGALGVREAIGTFTTRFPCCRPRVQNIRRIAELVDNSLVMPGETFSLNGKVGRRTKANGFVDAPQILKGEFVDDVGGGVSQFATTMFNAVFFSGLQDVEHKAHSYYITRYPEGREATVFFPSVDLKWKNDSPHGVLVTTSTTSTSVTVTFWGTKRYDIEAAKSPRTRIRPFEKRYVERDDCTAAEGHEGFDITVTRIFKRGGTVVKRERFFTRYEPEPNFICGPPPPGTPESQISRAS